MAPNVNTKPILPIAKDVITDARGKEKTAKNSSSPGQSNILGKHSPHAEAPDCYFKVIDISIDGTVVEDRGKCNFEIDLEKFYETIPTQSAHSIRVILDGRQFQSKSNEISRFPSCWLDEETSDAVSDNCPLYTSSPPPEVWLHEHLKPLRNMLIESTESSWHCTHMFVHHSTSCPHRSRERHLLQTDVDQCEQSVNLLKVTRDTSGNLLVVCRAPGAMISRTEHDPSPQQCANASWRFLTELEWSFEKRDRILQHANGNEQFAVQLLLLHILEVNLENVNAFVDDFLNVLDYRDHDRMKGTSNPPTFIGKSIIGRVITIGLIEESVNFIIRSIDFVSTSIRLGCASPPPPHLSLYLEALRQDCDSRRDHVSRLKQRLIDIHNALENLYNTNQGTSVKRLTLLASFFLPLSLAAAVLSMQNRLVDLNLLLYDFLGVVFILGALAAFFVWINRYSGPLYETIIFLNYGHRADNNPRIKRSLMVFWIATWWAALLASFLVGMLNDVRFGLKVLGFEAAGITAFWIISWKGFRWMYDRQSSRKQQKGEKKRAKSPVRSSTEYPNPTSPNPTVSKRRTTRTL